MKSPEAHAEEREEQNATDRRKTVLIVATHSISAIEFVETIGVLGLELELDELLQDRPDLRIAVTNARQASVFADILTIDIEES